MAPNEPSQSVVDDSPSSPSEPEAYFTKSPPSPSSSLTSKRGISSSSSFFFLWCPSCVFLLLLLLSSDGNDGLQVGTDLTRWRLKVTEGRHCWYYLETEEEVAAWPQTVVDKFHLGLLTDKDVPTHQGQPTTPIEGIKRGFEFYKLLQCDDGHWAGEYGGPLFLLPGKRTCFLFFSFPYSSYRPYPSCFLSSAFFCLPLGLIISCYVTESLDQISPPQRAEIIKYLFGKQRSEGGWGLYDSTSFLFFVFVSGSCYPSSSSPPQSRHIEDKSTMFGTALNYCVLRILGVPADHQVTVRARKLIKENGGAVGVPAWAKFWLALLNVYDWDGLHPVPPELWLLPYGAPVHPGRFWCHTRQVYLPMGYCYGHRITCKETALVRALREEIHAEPFECIDWYSCRSKVCPLDLYSPHTYILEAMNYVLHYYERYHISPLRQMALNRVRDLVKAEDDNTLCIGIGPVSKVINTVVAWHAEGRESKWFLNHMDRIRDYLWISDKGMMMCGTNGSQLWDTAFAAQALIESGLHNEASFRESVCEVLKFLDLTQLKRDVPNHDGVYRHISKGAWPFSTRDCGWIVSDCTAEGLKATLYFQALEYTPKLISDERLFDTVNVLLSMQNSDGGFATYEKGRGSAYLEIINPAEVFANIMIDYSYVECTSAVLQGLNTFKKFHPGHRRAEIEEVLHRGFAYIRSIQRPDGSWYGCWGVCFTYGVWFGTEALALDGEEYGNSEAQKKACDFLLSKQKEDGGWGETFKSCETGEYCDHEFSQTVNTAWSIMALMAAKYPDREPIERGARLILQHQDKMGHWPYQSIMGVFNKSCAIDYPNYQNIFPLWALGRYNKIYGNAPLL